MGDDPEYRWYQWRHPFTISFIYFHFLCKYFYHSDYKWSLQWHNSGNQALVIQLKLVQTHWFQCGKGGLVSISSQISNSVSTSLNMSISAYSNDNFWWGYTKNWAEILNQLCVELQIAGSETRYPRVERF